MSGSEKRSWSIRHGTNPRSTRLRVGSHSGSADHSAAPPYRLPLLLFLFWTVHGPFSRFLLEEKEKMGGAMDQPSLVSNPPPPEGRVSPPYAGGHKKRQPIPSCLFFCRKTESHFTHLTTRRVRPKRPMALGMTIRLLNISDSSHTRSLEARVPRKMNTRAISV